VAKVRKAVALQRLVEAVILSFCNKIAFIIFADYHYMKFKINWDALGIVTSLACAIHCAILPLFLTSLPLFGLNIIENRTFEFGMIGLAFVVGIYSFWHGFKKHHHSYMPITIFTAGFFFLVLRMFVPHGFEVPLLIIAVLGIVVAHVINYKSCRIHNHAHADDCDH